MLSFFFVLLFDSAVPQRKIRTRTRGLMQRSGRGRNRTADASRPRPHVLTRPRSPTHRVGGCGAVSLETETAHQWHLALACRMTRPVVDIIHKIRERLQNPCEPFLLGGVSVLPAALHRHHSLAHCVRDAFTTSFPYYSQVSEPDEADPRHH